MMHFQLELIAKHVFYKMPMRYIAYPKIFIAILNLEKLKQLEVYKDHYSSARFSNCSYFSLCSMFLTCFFFFSESFKRKFYIMKLHWKNFSRHLLRPRLFYMITLKGLAPNCIHIFTFFAVFYNIVYVKQLENLNSNVTLNLWSRV